MARGGVVPGPVPAVQQLARLAQWDSAPDRHCARRRSGSVRRRPARAQLQCGDCGARWSHLSDGLTGRVHYQACVVSRAVARTVLDGAPRAEIARDHGCHRRTLGRWVARVAAIAAPARLAGVLLAAAGAPILPAPPVSRPSRSARLMALGTRAVAVLALLEALASLHGLEPPALAHAGWLVPADVSSTDIVGGARSSG
jgi:hypothetical protein